jgi:EmrB/QacA subfamily drug resistance transporter
MSPAGGLAANPSPGLALDIPSTAGQAIHEKFQIFGTKYRWILLVCMLSGSMATMLAATAINVALPAIIGAFGLAQDQAQWMSTAFLAASTIAMLANAWAVSAFGARATYLAALVVFLAGSVLGTVSPSYGLLILSRAMQGVAAGLLQPMSMLMIFQTFPDRLRGRAIGIFSIGVVLAPAFGPALGGYAVDLASWRLVFIATLPIALLALPMAALLMPGRDGEKAAKRPPLDLPGLLLIALTILPLLSFIANGDRDGWGSDISLIRIGLVSVSATVFIWWELRHPFPALNLRVFQQPQFACAGVVIAFVGTAIYGSTYLIPIFVQMAQGYSPTAAGVMMIPAGLAMVIGFPLAGQLTDMVDFRLLLAFGVIAFGTSVYLLAGVTSDTPYWSLVSWIVLSRVGISFCMPPANTTAIRAVPPELLPAATGAASFLMQIGGSLGVTCLAVILQRRMVFHGDHLASGMTEANSELLYWHQQFVMEATSAGVPLREAFTQAFRPISEQLAQEALVYAFRDSFYVCAVGFAALLLFVAFIPRPATPQG